MRRRRTKEWEKSEYRRTCESLYECRYYDRNRYEYEKYDYFQLTILLEASPSKIKYIINPSVEICRFVLDIDWIYASHIPNMPESLQLDAVKNCSDCVKNLRNPTEEVQEYVLLNLTHLWSYLNRLDDHILVKCLWSNPNIYKTIYGNIRNRSLPDDLQLELAKLYPYKFVRNYQQICRPAQEYLVENFQEEACHIQNLEADLILKLLNLKLDYVKIMHRLDIPLEIQYTIFKHRPDLIKYIRDVDHDLQYLIFEKYPDDFRKYISNPMRDLIVCDALVS